MADELLRKNTKDLIYLAKCAVSGEVPDSQRVAEMDLKQIFALAKKHSLAAVTACGLETASVHDQDFSEALGKNIRKIVSLDLDRVQITQRLESEGIWHMPLKGSILKDCYPRLGMREMSDCDILYDEACAGQVKKIMTELGYIIDEYDMHNVDSYEKPPVCRFEMHRKLFSPYQDDRLYDYYKDVKSRLIRDDGTQYGYHFCLNDFYLYLLAHEYKHYMSGGNGLRFLLDTFVFLRKHGEELDQAYLSAELEKLGLREFESKNRSLVEHLFGEKELNAEENRMLDYMLDAGTFGTVDNAVRNQIEKLGGGKKGKLRFVMRRILIPMKTMESAYPFFYRHKYLIPVLYPYRLWKGIFRSRKKIIAECRSLLKKR